LSVIPYGEHDCPAIDLRLGDFLLEPLGCGFIMRSTWIERLAS
jgi:hypothetical protein